MGNGLSLIWCSCILRGPRTSAIHFGKCGLHQGQGDKGACIDNGVVNFRIEDTDKVANVKSEWGVRVTQNQPGYKAGFRGWGDERDCQLCLNFALMYHSSKNCYSGKL